MKQYNEAMQNRLGAFFLDILEVVVFAVAIFLFIYLLVLQPHKIKGSSMEPNFPDREFILTDKVKYRLGEPARGDVVVFEAPGTNGEEFIKRIIGLPGEEISINGSKIHINGKELVENYLAKEVLTRGNAFLAEGKTIKVPADHFFVLGDNREASSDSRVWGFVPKANIRGRAWVVYWPIPNFGPVPSVTYSFN